MILLRQNLKHCLHQIFYRRYHTIMHIPRKNSSEEIFEHWKALDV